MDPSKHTDGDPSEPPRSAPPDGGGPASYPGEVSSSSSSPRPPRQQQQRDVADSQCDMRADAALPSAAPSPSMATSSDVQQLPALGPPYPTVPDPRVVHYGEMAPGGGPASYPGEISSSSSSSPPRPPPQQQQDATDLQRHMRADAPLPSAAPSPSMATSSDVQQLPALGPPVPDPRVVHYGEMTSSGASSPRQQQLWPIAPPLQQFGPQHHGYRGSEPSSIGGYVYMFDAAGNFLATLRPQFWPQPPQSGPQFWPQQPQSGPQFRPQSRPQFWPQPPMYLDPTLEEIRLVLLRSPMMLGQLVMSRPDYSAILVSQLDLEDEAMRRLVLNAFLYCAHRIMGNRQGHPVFEALLRSFHERHYELSEIVQAAVTPHLVLRSNDGVTSLRMLIKAVAWNHDLSAWLVERFVCEMVMDLPGGDALILRCFITMPYEVTMALVQHAMVDIDRKLGSLFGSRCLGTCFRYAAGDELPYFQDIVRDRAVQMAKLRHGTYLVQGAIDDGSIQFREELVLKLMQQVVPLSLHHYGIRVVHHCFLLEEVKLLRIVLRACADLPLGDLQSLVMQQVAPNLLLPLHRPLLKAYTDFPELAQELAEKINLLNEFIRKHPDMELLMSAVTRVLADNLAISAISLS